MRGASLNQGARTPAGAPTCRDHRLRHKIFRGVGDGDGAGRAVGPVGGGQEVVLAVKVEQRGQACGVWKWGLTGLEHVSVWRNGGLRGGVIQAQALAPAQVTPAQCITGAASKAAPPAGCPCSSRSPARARAASQRTLRAATASMQQGWIGKAAAMGTAQAPCHACWSAPQHHAPSHSMQASQPVPAMLSHKPPTGRTLAGP